MANKNFYTQFTNRRLLIGADGKNRTFWRSGKEFYTVFLQENAEEHKKYAELGEMGHIYNIISIRIYTGDDTRERPYY